MNLFDLYPTIVAMAGLPEKAGLDGRNLLPLVSNPDPFDSIGNVGIQVPDGPADLLAGVTDPDGDGVILASLGVHERWNNPTDKQYSRNLGTGNGIELQYIKLKHYPGDLNSDDYVGFEDLMQLTEQWLWTGGSGAILEDLIEDGTVNLNDFAVISENWKNSF